MEKIYNKIKSLDELGKIIAELKGQGKKVVQCHGVFDLIHPGHVRHLAAARNEGDVLIVTITEDAFVRKGPDRPVFTSQLRAETLAAMENVDYVAVNNAPTAVNCIEILKPDVYVKGRDYENKEEDLTGKITDEENAVKKVGGKVVFTHDITFSSSKLINEHMDTFPKETRDYLKSIAGKYSTEKIVAQLKAIEKLKVLVIGDAIVDQYFYCESMGRSLKGHIIVTKYQSDESFAGGVFATANNVSSICSNVSMITLLGEKDEHERFVNRHLHKNITAEYFYRTGSPTTVKRRYVDEANSRK
jgi:rfaE bifunctional protein nucleotidyltransferase chain/domain